MSSKVLQKPKIIEILGSTIRIEHPDISNEVGSFLADSLPLGNTSITVKDNSNFADGDYLIVGQIGDNQTEELHISGAVTPGLTIPVSNSYIFDHELEAPVTKIYERAFKIYGAATDGGAGTLITSIDAIVSPIAKAVMIQWGKPFSEYTIKNGDTVYNFYYVTFYDGTTESPKSDYVPAAGYDSNAVASIIRAALDVTDTQIDNSKFTWPMLTRFAQNWQDAVSQYAYQDTVSGRLVKKDWAHEKAYSESILIQQNEDQYNLSSLNLKYTVGNRAIVKIKIGDNEQLTKIDQMETYDDLMVGKHRTVLTAQANAGDTTITVDSTADFDDAGSVTIGSQNIVYTGKTSTTFTGIPATGVGSISATLASGKAVWQNLAQGTPRRFTIADGILKLDLPPDALNDGKKLKIDYYKKLTPLTESSDKTVIPFVNTGETYIAAKIEQRKQNADKMQNYMKMFRDQMLENAQSDSTPIVSGYNYYDYGNYDLEDDTTYDIITVSQ